MEENSLGDISVFLVKNVWRIRTSFCVINILEVLTIKYLSFLKSFNP
jgi:hypothetical protein